MHDHWLTVKQDLSWSKECIMFEISIILRVILYNSVAVIQTTGATSQINNAKLYVPVFTLSRNDNIKFLEKIEQGFKRTISWNKFRFEITAQIKKHFSLSDWSNI